MRTFPICWRRPFWTTTTREPPITGAQYHSFSREDALANYGRPREILQEKTPEEYRPFIDGNVDLLEQLVRDYPDTVFCFFYPPYSLLWWDNMIRSGQLEQSLYAAEASMERLLSYDNVRIYYFQNEEDVTLDLDLYMDPIHFSEDINHTGWWRRWRRIITASPEKIMLPGWKRWRGSRNGSGRSTTP